MIVVTKFDMDVYYNDTTIQIVPHIICTVLIGSFLFCIPTVLQGCVTSIKHNWNILSLTDLFHHDD